MRLPGTIKGQGRFAQVPQARIPRSQFNRSHGHKTTFDAAGLVPILLDEVLPGDTFNVRATLFCRMNTPVVPIMDNLYLDTFYFFVPYRLLWSNWEKFNGAQDDPGDSTDYTIPQQTVPAGGYDPHSLEDYFGIPTDVVQTTTGWTHSALPRRAYWLIWDEWFRDQNLQDSQMTGSWDGDGPDGVYAGSGTALKPRGKRHDYFTSCLPWPQKGDAVEIPLDSGDMPVVGEGTAIPTFDDTGGTGTAGQLEAKAASDPSDVQVDFASGTPGAGGALMWNDTALEVDLSAASFGTINELRQAFQIQKLLERDARGGTRYVEVIRSHFGVTSPDYRLQRPEYLGGDSQMINISPVAQTSATASEPTELGALAGIGTAVSTRGGFVKSFTEHGLIMGLANVRADLTYQEGLERFWSRSTRYDFYWPALALLGEQAVYNREIYLQDAAQDDDVFGYQERYAEYRYKPSKITGKLRSSATGTLEIWHLAEEFGTLPSLDDTFIVSAPPVDRVVATPTEPHFTCDMYFRMICARPMPVFSVPGLIDHF